MPFPRLLCPLVALALLAHPAPAGADTLKTLRVGMIPTVDSGPFYVALTKGFFKEEGLEIDQTPTNGGATGIPAVIAGALDIAAGNVVSTVLAAARGLDILAIAPASKIRAHDPDLAAIVVAVGSDLKSGRDFDGKILAVNTRNTVLWLFGRAWIRKMGGDPGRAIIKEVPFPQMQDALNSHQVDAAFMVAPFLNNALSNPTAYKRIAEPYQEVQPGVDVGQYEATSAFTREHKAETDAFLRAVRKGVAWFNANRQSDELAAIISGYSHMAVEMVKKIDLPEAPSLVDPAQIAITADLMRQEGLLTEPFDASKIAYLPATVP